MTKAYSVLNVKSAEDNGDERIITGIASTPTADRDNDVMDMDGASFSLPMPLLWQHNHNQPIGEVTSATVTTDGIEITAKIVKIEEDGVLKNRVDEAWQSIKSGLVKCLSIGFKIIEYNYIKETYGYHIKEWEWYELSAVTIPANPDAVITDVKQIKKAFNAAQNNSVPDSKPTKQRTLIPPNKSFTNNTTSDPAAPATESQPRDFIVLVDPNAGSIPLITE